MLEALGTADAIIVADYGRGLAAAPALRDALAQLVRRIPVVWDPHRAGPDPVEGVAAATPNLPEALRMAGLEKGGAGEAALAAAELRARWNSSAVVVTLGGEGAMIQQDGELPQAIPAARDGRRRYLRSGRPVRRFAGDGLGHRRVR